MEACASKKKKKKHNAHKIHPPYAAGVISLSPKKKEKKSKSNPD